MTCTELQDGSSMCMQDLVCQEEWMSCGDGRDCCDGLTCLNNRKGGKQCRKLPSCMPVWDDCSVIGCCGSLQCKIQDDGSKQCRDTPGCVSRRKDCSETGCCAGLTCIEKDDRQYCERLPTCVRQGQSCKYTPCCSDDPRKPLQCVDVMDDAGREAKQCRLVPGQIEVSKNCFANI